jgi:hypothetical protein
MRKGRRHPRTALLSLTTVAILAGCKSSEAIAPLDRDHGPPPAFALGLTRGKGPNESRLCKLLRRLDVAALDGKTVRGSANGDVPAAHQLTANAADLLERARANWGIENGLPYGREETPGEDRCRVRAGDGAQGRAALRDPCVHLRGDVKAPSKAAATRR